MTDNSHISVVFQGSKFFWRTRNNIDVTIISHTDLDMVEVIAYEPSVDVEAERIYLNLKILNSRLNQAEIEAKFSFAKQNNVAHTEQFEADVIKRATSDFVLNHLFIKEFSKDDRKFSVQLQFGDDGSDANSRLICDKPTVLLPFETKHYKLYTGNEVSEALRALENEQSNLEEQCTKAIEMHTQAGVQLSHKERWRIPLVLGKLAKNKTLNDSDSKIWTAVSSNLKTQEDIDNITKVTLRIVTPRRPVTPVRSGSRTPIRTRSSLSTPNRSPCLTPRLTPRSRADSQRLFNGTISSQNKTTGAEDAAPTSPPRKLSKRAGSKSGSKVPKHPSSRSRNLTPRRTSTDESAALVEDPVDNGIAGTSEKTTSLMEQVSAGIASFAANVSAKLGGRGSSKIVEGASKETGTSVIFHCREGDGASWEFPKQQHCNHLHSSVCSMPLTQDAGGSADTDDGAAPTTHPVTHRVKPSKRRSYFGSLLASFTGSTQDAPDIALKDSAEAKADDNAEDQQPSPLTLSNKRTTSKKRSSVGSGEGLSFSAALAAWFPWTQSASVVPVDLPEYVPVELTAEGTSV